MGNWRSSKAFILNRHIKFLLLRLPRTICEIHFNLFVRYISLSKQNGNS